MEDQLTSDPAIVIREVDGGSVSVPEYVKALKQYAAGVTTTQPAQPVSIP